MSVRRSTLLALLASALLLPVAARAQGRSPAALARLQDSVAAAGGRVIVLLKSTLNAGGRAAAGAPPVGDTEFNQVENRIDGETGIAVTGKAQRFGAVFATATTTGLAALNSDPNVLAIEADVFTPIQSSRTLEDSYRAPGTAQTTPWGIAAVRAPESWSMTNGGAGVKVGVLDSGGDSSHPDLLFAGGYNGKTSNSAQSAWQDDLPECLGHGTHVAGTIAARDNDVGVVGVAPNVSLYALKVMEVVSGQCGALTSSQVNALNWAVTNGIKVVNASLGSATSSGSMSAAVASAAAAGTIFVASSGNGSAASVYFPAAYAGSIAVGSVDSGNNRAGSSNYGPELWIMAPGVNIESTMPGGGYGSKNGTSMASPHVAGVVALLLAQTPGMSLAQVKQKLKDGALDLGNQAQMAWGLTRAFNSLGGGSAVPLALALSPSSRSVSAVAGSAAAGGTATVSLTGDNSTTTAWSATRKKSWTTLTTASGTGNGTVAWNRSTTGLSAGTYVDTLTVTAGAAGSKTVIDTLVVTAAPVALVLAVSPASRFMTAVAGTAAAGGTAGITLTGDNASSTAWSATKKKSWTTLTTANGTGNGTVAWSRSTTGLSAGIYVDTVTVTAGAAGSKTVIDTLTITAAPVPLVLALSPSSRSVSAVAGGSAAGTDATVTLTGDNASNTAWTATKKKSWTTLTTASGTGNGTAAWSRSLTGLSAGTYVDTITVTAGTAGSKTVIDTLTVTAAPVALTLTVSPSSRFMTAVAGSAAASGTANISLTGDNASSTAWSATKKKSWTTLTTASGTGNGTLAWSRSTTGLSAGTYVDTLTVTAGAAGSKTVIDTLTITAAPVALVLTLSPSSRFMTAVAGAAAASGTANITLTGDNASSTGWSATKKKSWTTLTTASGTGNGVVAWSRSTAGLSAGTYVDTLTVTAGAAGSKTVIDTLTITAAPVALTLVVTPATHRATTMAGTAAPSDSATVTLAGDNASSTIWVASKKKSWTSLVTSSGTGTGKVRWNRNTAGLVAGTYVDTLSISASGASGSPAMVIDTLVITAIPVPLVLDVTPASRRTSVTVGASAGADSATIALTGDNAASASWSASRKKSWTTLTTASGTGNGKVRWSRNTTGLTVGTYVDTITVTASGAINSPATVIDTLVIAAAPVPVVLALSPASRRASAQQATAAPGDLATVTLTGDNAAGTAWTASKKKSWTMLIAASGTGNGSVTWSRNTTGLTVGTYVDTITVTAGAAGSKSVIDTLVIGAIPVPLVASLSPSSRAVSLQQGGSAPNDAASVVLTGDGASSAGWTATRKRNWTTLTTASGTGNGNVTWSRNTSSLGVGLYVDTITVAINGSPATFATVIDTIRVNAVPVPLGMFLSPRWRRTSQVQGPASIPDSASVTITGDNASSASWSATRRRSWNTLLSAAGTGNGKLRWTRNTSGMTAGMYIDTITVNVAGLLSETIVDTLEITAVADAPTPKVSINPRSKFLRMIFSLGFWAPSSVTETRDSAVVSGDGSPEMVGMLWEATSSSSRLQIITPTGTVDSKVTWARTPQGLSAGTYVDTVKVHLMGQAEEAYFIDTLTVAQVAAPTAPVAVKQLVSGNGLSSDQLVLLDQIGNRNGRFDLGDFLAWIDRGGVAVSPAQMQQLMALPAELKGDVSTTPKKPGGTT